MTQPPAAKPMTLSITRRVGAPPRVRESFIGNLASAKP